MPNDRATSSLLQQANLAKYKTLGKFLELTSTLQTSTGETSGVLDSQQALDLLNQAIDEVEVDRQTKSEAVSSQGQKERSVQADLPLENVAVNSTEVAKSEELPEAQLEASGEAPAEASAEIELNPKTELAELGQEISELGKEVKEQRDQEEVKAQQAAINDLATSATAVVSDVKPVVVLPISEEKQRQAKYKSTNFSLHWLAEWAKKISKIFSGAVIYKEEVANSEDA